MNLYASLGVVSGEEFLSTQITDIWIVPSMTLHVYLYTVPGDDTFTTHSTLIWILHRMTLLVFLHVVAEFLSSFTHTTMVCNLPGMALHVYCLVIPEAFSEYFIHRESSLPPKCLQIRQSHVEYFWPPSAYSFHQGPGIISFSLMAFSIFPGSVWVMLAITSNHNFLF